MDGKIRYDLTKIKRSDEVCYSGTDINEVTRLLIAGTAIVGLNRITKENIDEWMFRINALRESDIAIGVLESLQSRKTFKWWPSEEQLRRHIGLQTSVCNESRNMWRCLVQSGYATNFNHEIYNQHTH